MKTFTSSAFVLILVSGGVEAALLPGDATQGKVLHDKNCVACHDSSVYTRPNRSIKSVEALIGRVKGCVNQVGAKLDREQVNSLVKYLDDSFYKFE